MNRKNNSHDSGVDSMNTNSSGKKLQIGIFKIKSNQAYTRNFYK